MQIMINGLILDIFIFYKKTYSEIQNLGTDFYKRTKYDTCVNLTALKNSNHTNNK